MIAEMHPTQHHDHQEWHLIPCVSTKGPQAVHLLHTGIEPTAEDFKRVELLQLNFPATLTVEQLVRSGLANGF